MDVVKIRLKAEKFISEELLNKIMCSKMDGMIKKEAVEAYRYGVGKAWIKKQRTKTPEYRERRFDRQQLLYREMMLGKVKKDGTWENGTRESDLINVLCAE